MTINNYQKVVSNLFEQRCVKVYQTCTQLHYLCRQWTVVSWYVVQNLVVLESFMLKPLSARIRSPGTRFFKKCECLTMLASETDPGYNGETYTHEPLGATAVSAFTVCRLIQLLYDALC